MTRQELVQKISSAFADGKDSGGYDTLYEMLAHTALKTLEQEYPARCPWIENDDIQANTGPETRH